MFAWIQLQSSAISAAAYQDNSLFIRFTSGCEYEYYNVPVNVYEELIKAPSIGQYFNNFIKNQYPYRKISA